MTDDVSNPNPDGGGAGVEGGETGDGEAGVEGGETGNGEAGAGGSEASVNGASGVGELNWKRGTYMYIR